MRFARSQVIFWSTLLLLLLSACGSAPVQPSPTHAGTTPTLTFPPTPTNIPLPFLPNDHDPFQATFIERAPVTTCPPSSKPTDLCFHVSGTGTSIPYGSLSNHLCAEEESECVSQNSEILLATFSILITSS